MENAAVPTPPPDVAAAQRRLQAVTYGLIATSGFLSLLICGLRLYVRKFVIKLFGLDDIAVVVALTVTQVFNGLGMAVVYYGCGKHIQYVSPEDFSVWIKLYYAAMCLYLYVALAVRLSLLVFLRRIFPKAWLRHLTSGLAIFLVLFTISGSLVLALQCRPVRAAFDLTITEKTCLSQFRLYQIVLYQAVLMFMTDIIILTAPMPILASLKMPSRKVVALMAIFGTGIIATIAPVVRFSTLDYLLHGTQDLTYEATSSLYWMAIEFNLSLVAGSLSSLRPLPFFRRFGSSNRSLEKGSTGNTPNAEQSLELRGIGSGKSRKNHNIYRDETLLQTVTSESQEYIVHHAKEMAVSGTDKTSVNS